MCLTLYCVPWSRSVNKLAQDLSCLSPSLLLFPGQAVCSDLLMGRDLALVDHLYLGTIPRWKQPRYR